MPILDRTLVYPGFAAVTNWRGRSGQYYALMAERLADFMLSSTRLSILTSGSIVLWVGSATEVIADPVRRAAFRLALSRATQVYSAPAPSGDVERVSMAWDLETAEPTSNVAAA